MKVDRFIEGGIAVLLCAFVGVLYVSLHDNVIKAGDKAPDFRLQADNGQEVALSGLRGRPVVLYFFPKALTSG